MISVLIVILAITLVVEGVLQTQVTCEYKTMALKCASGLTLQSANYGRQDKTTCPASYPPTSKMLQLTSCSSTANPMDIVKKACNGKRDCSVLATNGVLGGDPCKGTYKYLTVTYDCPADGAATAAAIPTNAPIAPPQTTVKSSLQSIITTVPPKPTTVPAKTVVNVATTAKPAANTVPPKTTAKSPATVATTAKPTAASKSKSAEAKSNSGNHYGESTKNIVATTATAKPAAKRS